MTTRKRLCSIKGISEAKVDKIKEVATKLGGVSPMFLITLLFIFGDDSRYALMYTYTAAKFDRNSTFSSTQDGAFLTALEYADKRKQCFRITTGSQELEYVMFTSFVIVHVSRVRYKKRNLIVCLFLEKKIFNPTNSPFAAN